MNNEMDVETYIPQDGDKYFFDANIWLYFYCPIGDYNKNTISITQVRWFLKEGTE